VPVVIVKRTIVILLALALAPAWGRAQGLEVAPASPLDSIDWAKAPEYRIVPGDQLRFNFGPPATVGQVVISNDVIREVTVRPDGRVTVYPVGDLVAAGRTTAELQAEVMQLLSAELRQPRVTVEVSKLAGNEVHVLGRVKVPGPKPVSAFTTLLQAIAAAGGFEDDAARNSVMIMHRVGLDAVSIARVRVDRMLKNGGDMPVGRYDIIYVPRSTVGNMNLFAHQFFEGGSTMISTAIQGWELFHLRRIFPGIAPVAP